MFADEMQAAYEAWQEGRAEEAASILRLGIAAARRAAEGGMPGAMAWLVGMTDRLDTLLADNTSERLRIWDALGVTARRRAEPVAELSARLQLAQLHFEAGDLDTAVRHAVTGLRMVPQCEGQELDGGEVVIGVPDRQFLYQGFVGTASTLYYEYEKFAETAALATELVALLPDEPGGWFLLGYAALRQEDHERAISALTEVTRLQPDRAGPYAGLSIAYHGVGRLTEAIAAIDRAIELDPDQIRHRHSRAQLRHIAGDLAGALAELDELIDWAERLAADEAPAEEAASQVDYERNMPMRDLADIAGMDRWHVLVELGRLDEARAAAMRMTEVGDRPTAGTGHGLLARLLADAGDHEAAIRHHTAQLELDMSIVDARLGRARSYSELGRIDEALADLEALSGQAEDQDPRSAAEALAELVERHPGHFRARKALARARVEAWQPARAAALLTELVEEQPDDWELHAWLGMAQVTISGDPDDEVEQQWSNETNNARVLTGIDHLTDAVRVAGGDERPRQLLRWLVERACALVEIFGLLVTRHVLGAYVEGFSLTDALPELAEPFTRIELAARHEGPSGEWHLAVAELVVARAALADAELPVLAAQVDLKLADNYLRMFEIQRVLDHVDAAERAWPVLSQLPPNVANRRDIGEIIEGPAERGRKMMLVDFDHMLFNMAASTAMRRTIDLLRAQASHRTGDTAGALDALDDGDDDFQLVYQRAVLLRDSGRLDEAAALLPRLEELGRGANLLRVTNLRATIHLVRGETEQAAAIVRATLAEVPADSYAASVLASNLAETYLQSDEPAEALAVADQYPLSPEAPPSMVYGRHVMRGRALQALEDWSAALASYQLGLAVSEDLRGRLRAEQDRMSWQQTQQGIYQEAVYAAVNAGDVIAAFELVERSKARAFLDQLGIGLLAPPGDTSRLRQNWERARKRRALLENLAASPDPGVEVELLHQLAALGSDFTGPTEENSVERELAAETEAVERLARQLADAHVSGLESVAGPTLSYQEIRDSLPPNCLLAEFFVSDYYTLLFLIGGEEPDLVLYEDLGRDEVVETVNYFVGGDVRQLNAEEFADDMGSLVQPIVERTEPGDVVVLVPHGPLHYLPMHAALVDRNPVCHLPSASLLRYRRPDVARQWTNALVLGDSRDDLVHARQEARAVAARFGTRAFVGPDASRERFTRDAPSADLVHIACHGQFDGERALRSSVLLADEDLTVEDAFGLRLSANLVTLSACESGVSDSRPGDELIGLTRAVLHAGVPSLVVSLWEVDDLSTSLLMNHFYAEASAGAGLADALRSAQRRLAAMSARDVVAHCERELPGADQTTATMLQLDRAWAMTVAGDIAGAIEACRAATGDRRAQRLLNLLKLKAEAPPPVDYEARPFAHPFYWAAFVLVGDWR